MAINEFSYETGNLEEVTVDTQNVQPKLWETGAFFDTRNEPDHASWLKHFRKLGEVLVGTAVESAGIKANQLVHDFGIDEFWRQLRRPLSVETSFGTSHKVRIIGQERLADPDSEHVLIINPLGTSSAGGYMAEVANTFYEAGFIVWNVSSPGFEGKLPIRELLALNIKRETKYVDEAIEAAAEQLGIERPKFNAFGGSQGGGIAVGMLYRDIWKSREHGKVFAVTPSSGHNSQKLGRLVRYAKQFLIDEPQALKDHLANHPKGPLRRSLQLLPTVNLRPSAIAQVLAGGPGLVLKPGHEDFLGHAGDEEMSAHFDPSKFVVVCFSKDVVARANKWPGSANHEMNGLHMFVVDSQHAETAAKFFRSKPIDSTDTDVPAA